MFITRNRFSLIDDTRKYRIAKEDKSNSEALNEQYSTNHQRENIQSIQITDIYRE